MLADVASLPQSKKHVSPPHWAATSTMATNAGVVMLLKIDCNRVPPQSAFKRSSERASGYRGSRPSLAQRNERFAISSRPPDRSLRNLKVLDAS
jgi:hypothetical protein